MKDIREAVIDELGEIGERERKAKRNVDAIAIGLATALNDPSEKVFREVLEELDDVRPTSPEWQSLSSSPRSSPYGRKVHRERALMCWIY